MATKDDIHRRSILIRDAAFVAMAKLEADERWRTVMTTHLPAELRE